MVALGGLSVDRKLPASREPKSLSDPDRTNIVFPQLKDRIVTGAGHGIGRAFAGGGTHL
jgi:hypothetical protein